MNKLESLVQISQYYGKNPAYVIAGGGNTSYKNSEKLHIKASGVALADIDINGFVVMSRELLNLIGDKTYSENSIQREEEVKQDLKNAIISPEHLRPSVETSLHNLINYSYIIHTHPTMINAVMCAKNAKIEIEERFGSEAIYVEYTDPGYILFKKLKEKIQNYQQENNKAPKIIFLQNHGIFVGANSAREVKAIYDSVESRIRERKSITLPEDGIVPYKSDTSSFVSDYFAPRGLVSGAFTSPLIRHFSASESQYLKINRPFTPDIIVYCKSKYLFVEQATNEDVLVHKLKAFEDTHGYYPKVIVEENGGLILVEENKKSVQTVLEVYYDMLKISYLSEDYGGPNFMTDEQISFIDNWEVENYRRSVAKSV